MDDNIKYILALIFLAAATIYVIIKNRSWNKERHNQQNYNQKRENKEKDIESLIYKKEIDRLDERLKRKEISWDDFVKLRIKLDEQNKKNIDRIHSSKIK